MFCKGIYFYSQCSLCFENASFQRIKKTYFPCFFNCLENKKSNLALRVNQLSFSLFSLFLPTIICDSHWECLLQYQTKVRSTKSTYIEVFFFFQLDLVKLRFFGRSKKFVRKNVIIFNCCYLWYSSYFVVFRAQYDYFFGVFQSFLDLSMVL